MTKRTLVLAVLATACCGVPLQADIGLGARFGDVILEGVQPGRTYDLREATHVPFGVENRGDAEAEVIIEFLKTGKNKLAKDYEAAPDPSWFKAIPERLIIGPKAVGYFNLLLTVPDDPALKGKSYQVSIRARTVGEGMLQVSVDGRLRFSMGPGPDSLLAEKKKKAMQRLDFDITPRTLYLIDVPAGKTWDSRKEASKTIRVANYAPDPLTVNLIVDPWDAMVPMPEGYEKLPDLSWVRVQKSTLSVGTDEIGSATLVVSIPDEPQNRGKRWVATVRTALASGFWLDMPVKLHLETKP